MNISVRPSYSAAVMSMSRRQATARPGTPDAGGGEPTGKQFSTDLLNALMNRAAGGTNSTLRLANLGAGEAPLECNTVNTPNGARTCARGGEPVGDEVYSRDAEALAFDLVRSIGSDGALSRAEVEEAMGLKEATCDAQDLRVIRAAIESNWNMLSGGSDTMTARGLSEAISRYLG